MATPAPPSPAPSSSAPALRRPRPAPGPVAAALAGLALFAAVSATGQRASPTSPPTLGAADPCVSPAAVAAFAGWPPAATSVGDDEYEARGERRPDALAVPAGFRAFQACRRRTGG
jgi:hypothetical protein